jgi:hypothetical protein
MARAADLDERPRQINTCFPRDWVMRITDLNEATGEFQAVRVEGT